MNQRLHRVSGLDFITSSRARARFLGRARILALHVAPSPRLIWRGLIDGKERRCAGEELEGEAGVRLR